MIRPNKVKTMTRAAMFEKKEARGALAVNRFFRSDYVIYGMIKSAISLTIAFALAVGMWVIYHAEELMTEKSVADLFALAKLGVFMYVAALVVFLLISLVVYVVRYQKAQNRLKEYRSHLRKLAKLYQDEASAKEKML